MDRWRVIQNGWRERRREEERERETQTKEERGGKRKENDDRKRLKGIRSVRGKIDIKNTVRNTNI